ncbi:MAG: type III-A CRISPR-associated RAMP protein Csm3 [Desulfobacteraceae bacterium 4572_187]|nr:MAG: type III-A CRISPR-associated RAMP protein Csm3 [Desulfobacteraceae bacterium 4572_187]
MAKQAGNHFKYLFGNIILNCIMDCKTGLHIGGSSDTIEIGGIDSLVVRNPLTHEPYIPGSSMKGKLRSIVEKIVTKNNNPLFAERPGGDKGKKVWRHECDDFDEAVGCPLCRIFGATGYTANNSDNNNYPSIINVRDSALANPEELKDDDDVMIFEAKTENALDRLTSAAHPRCIERVPAGAKFNLEIVYRVEEYGEKGNFGKLAFTGAKKLEEDLSNLLNAMAILEYDGLGGHISRGYGKVEFNFRHLTGCNAKGNEIAKIENPDTEKKLLSPHEVSRGISNFATSFVGGCNNGETDEISETEV